MSYETENYEYKGLRIRIVQDDDPTDPEDCDIPVYLVHFHNQFQRCPDEVPFSNAEGFSAFLQPRPKIEDYVSGDDNDDDRSVQRDRWEEDCEAWDEDHEEWAVFMVSSYIHSGVVLALAGSLEDARFPDRQWDVSHCGAILIKKDGEWGSDADNEGYSYTRDGQTVKVPWRNVAESHLKTWNQCLEGDVWGYVVERITTCEHCGEEHVEQLDSCWGYYGVADCKAEAESVADSYAEE